MTQEQQRWAHVDPALDSHHLPRRAVCWSCGRRIKLQGERIYGKPGVPYMAEPRKVEPTMTMSDHYVVGMGLVGDPRWPEQIEIKLFRDTPEGERHLVEIRRYHRYDG
jgi:hypothetical protein